jgi:hypothetical protein
VSGEWDVIVENYGVWSYVGTYPQVFRITQDGNSFAGIRLKDNPSPARGLAGSRCAQGEVDKSGFKKIEIVGGGGEIMPSKWQISEDGNKITLDAPQHTRHTWTRR